MAQRKTKAPKAEKAKAPKVVESFAARAAKMLREEFGDESADTLADGGYSKVHSVLPTGIEVLDRWVIGIGGLPYGRIIEISGPEDVGKSSLINQLMGAAQRDGAVACLGDAERKVQPEWVDVFGVDRKEIILLPAETVEQFLSQIRTMLRKYGKTKKLVFILDSVATCMPKKALESDLNEAEIPGAMGAAWSRGLRALHKPLSASSSMLILVNQLRCVHEDELVVTERGICAARDAMRDKSIVGRDGVLTSISASAETTTQMRRVLLKDGRQLRCGPSHPILVASKESPGYPVWTKVEKLRGGDWVAVPRKIQIPIIPPVELPRLGEGDSREMQETLPAFASDDFCTFLGMWFSDGCILRKKEYAVIIGERSPERGAAIEAVAKKLGWSVARFGKYGYRFGSRVCRLLIAIGCDTGDKSKMIPSVITGLDQWRAFLRGMFDSHVVGSGFYMTFASAAVARRVQLALLGFGIYGKLGPSRVRTGAYLYISGTDAARYYDEIGFSEESKLADVRRAIGVPDESSRGKADVVPYAAKRLNEAMRVDGGSRLPVKMRNRIKAAAHKGTNVASRDFRDASKAYSLHEEASKFRWIQIRQIFTSKEPVKMVDFDVPLGSAFVAGGIVTHNSKIGVMYGPTEDTPGGRAIKHYASLRIGMGHGKSVKDGDKHVAKWANVRVLKNHLGPGANHRKATILLDFEVGWNDERSTMYHAKEMGCVTGDCRSIEEARKNLGWSGVIEPTEVPAST